MVYTNSSKHPLTDADRNRIIQDMIDNFKNQNARTANIYANTYASGNTYTTDDAIQFTVSGGGYIGRGW